MKRIAVIRANDKIDGDEIYFEMDEQTFEVTLSNGDEVSYGKTPSNVAETFEIIDRQWGKWDTFDWTAEYNEATNEVIEY